MILSKQSNTTVYPRCYDAASSAAPQYWLKIFSVPTQMLVECLLTDTSTTPTSYQKFVVNPSMLGSVNPGSYKYQIVDRLDDDKILERGRVTITDTNHELTSHGITDTLTAHAVE
jgi:hypothetical protein